MTVSRGKRRAFHESDGGFTTVGMVLALLISLSLIFTAARVYQVESAAADVQNVADAAALAAENQVASFYIVAQVCDAVVLSLSLTGIVAAGLGVAALCTPVTAELSPRLLETAQKLFDARDKFADKAADGLNQVQKLLPYLAAAQAASIARANSEGKARASYIGCAVLLPTEGEQISVGALDGSQQALDDIASHRDRIAEQAAEAEQAAQEANEHKLRAYMADCGNAPGYCMYERAGTLSDMGADRNPYYSSVETWSFSVALARAQAYYPQRLAREHPANDSVVEQSNSAVRVRFYEYACKRIRQGYVHEDVTGSFDADFPVLSRNTDEMRKTELYTESVYPITDDGSGKRTMHAWSGCPLAQSQHYVGTGSVAQWEAEHMDACPVCGFSAPDVGKIAAASTSIENGFEHHYNIVADEAKQYQEARSRYAPAAREVKGTVGLLMDELKELLSKAGTSRIKVSPPGHYGAVAIVADAHGIPADSFFPSSFVHGGGSLGARAALSAATLADDDPTETQNVLSSLFDGFADDAQGFGIGGLKVVVQLWSTLLTAYSDGQDALEQGVEDAIDAIPFASASGLGTWAANQLSQAAEAAGLQPADLAAGKPVIVNSYHVLSHDQGDFAQTMLRVKTEYAQLPGSGTGTPLAAALDAVESGLLSKVQQLEDRVLVVQIQLLGDQGPSIPITISLPPAAKQITTDYIASALQQLRGLANGLSGVRIWE